MFVFCSNVRKSAALRASRFVATPVETRILSVCACSSGSAASSPTHTNSSEGSFMQSWITQSSALFTHAFSGTKPSCVACWRKVSEVARLTWATKAEAGTEKA
jgi:hypothetical protein